MSTKKRRKSGRQTGQTTANIEIAVMEGGHFDDPRARVIFAAEMRSKLKPEKEGDMPAKNTTKKASKTKTKKAPKARKPAAVAHKSEIAELRNDIRKLHVQMKKLDGSLRKERAEEKSAARAAFYKKVRSFVWRIVKGVAKVAVWPLVALYKLVRHPIETPKAAYAKLKAAYNHVAFTLFPGGTVLSWPFRKIAAGVRWLAASRHDNDTPAEKTA